MQTCTHFYSFAISEAPAVFCPYNVFLTAASPRRSGAAARLQRVVRRRTRTAPRRAAAPIGSRRQAGAAASPLP
ncbi:hypothetical protein [Streptomyces sp. NBC_00887]|uniref:hypothetical protein n=1 Tax=Streptomyces sp. NBC_00887 TaxID=2975859 RepID=UPI00386F6386|nr:hypothetical protein OG844_11070 [Streptomyces sp. NBC_00887]